MPTQPARPPMTPQQKAKAESDQKMKQWAIIGFGTVILLIGGFFALDALMTEDRGGRSLVHEIVESKPTRKIYVDNQPVALYPRPQRLFDEYVKAVMNKDKSLVMRYSEFDEAKVDVLLNEEHTKVLTDAMQSNPKRLKFGEQKIEGGTARIGAVFQNSRGFDLMGLVLVMRQKGGPEDWLVTKVLTQWYSPSGKVPESQPVEIGADRAFAASPLKDPSTFNKVPEAEPKTLEWLPGTSEADKAAILGYIRDLFDEQHPAKLSKASTALATIGKPAIPMLLNEFIGLDLRKEDDIKRGNSVDRTLAALTDVEMGFDPAQFQSTGAIPPAEGRMRAIRRWFGWWDRNKDLPITRRNQPVEEK
jgi:hypothetical protein